MKIQFWWKLKAWTIGYFIWPNASKYKGSIQIGPIEIAIRRKRKK